MLVKRPVVRNAPWEGKNGIDEDMGFAHEVGKQLGVPG